MVYTNPIPTNYDASTISVDTSQLTSVVASITASVADIETNLTNINTTLQNLQLNWVGDAASEAQLYNDLWVAVVQLLFGTDGDANGALSILANGLNQAVDNYNANEAVIKQMFSPVAGATAPSNVVDQPTGYVNANEYLFHTTAVNET